MQIFGTYFMFFIHFLPNFTPLMPLLSLSSPLHRDAMASCPHDLRFLQGDISSAFFVPCAKRQFREKNTLLFAYIKKKYYLCSRKRIMEYTKHAFNCIFYYTNYAILCIMYYAAVISTSRAITQFNADGNRAGMRV